MRPLFLLLALLAVPASAVAQDCAMTFSGDGHAFCVSPLGQLASIQRPIGTERLDTSDIREGFTVCRGDDFGNIRAYAADDNINIDTAQFDADAHTVTLTDFGGLEVRQTFTWNQSEHALRVTMRVKNVGSATITNVRVQRAVDAGTNRGGATDASAFVWTADGAGLELGADSSRVSHGAFITSPDRYDRFDCGSFGDFDGHAGTTRIVQRVLYDFGTLRPNQYGTGTFLYRLF